jgi:putative acetyltransferase
LAEQDGRIVGYISLWGAFIGALFVDPACHGQGIGRQLVEAAAARKGGLAVDVYADNRTAGAFYRAVGFVNVRRRPTDGEGRPFALIRMERPPSA